MTSLSSVGVVTRPIVRTIVSEFRQVWPTRARAEGGRSPRARV